MSDPEMTTFGMYPEPEPVAWLHMLTVDGELFPKPTLVPRSDQDIPLYTAQPRREWVGLTDDDINDLWRAAMWNTEGTRLPIPEFARTIEAKLKEMNS